MRLPEEVRPILHETINSPAVEPGAPLEIWKTRDHRRWIDLFMEFGSKLFNSDLDAETLPRGYGLVGYLMDWEAQCQFEGWHAIDSRLDFLGFVIAGYRVVGLDGEADALSKAVAAWTESGGDYDYTNEAYNSVTNDSTVDLDRLEHMVCFFVDNAEMLFYVEGET